MNNIQNDFQNQLQTDTATVINKATTQLTRIKALQTQLKSNLSDVEISYNPQTNQPLSKAVLEIFGKETKSTTAPDENVITLDMYVYCVDVLRHAGKYKAANSLADKVF